MVVFVVVASSDGGNILRLVVKPIDGGHEVMRMTCSINGWV
jgi:hypothetical protein